ncbi:hypothetical protein DH2020_038728 [Rehmannia glutinosa]|uniref:Uncharacterized protein n=1 Tax=Rehmannia glutinosa TaxID=99300 RepID=A0ABR0UZP6_REHGL
MGSCLSKKSVCASSSSPVDLPKQPEKPKSETQSEKKKTEEENVVKKEIFIIKHRKSHEVERQRSDEEKGEFAEKGKNVISGTVLDGGLGNGSGGGGGGAPVRTSSCTKEEVDAILIQCGRLSRSSSTGKAGLSSGNGGRKYSGSKRSFDFDSENGNNPIDGDDDAVARERENRRRERHRHSQGRRRTPSREREKDQAAAGQHRSGSKERGGSGGGGRRVSRSPNRRSESPITTNSSGSNSNSNSNLNSNPSAAINANSRPGKMVSVPATVTSLAMDKSNNAAAGGGGEANAAASVKRIQVKRNVGGDGAAVGTRTGASPRARSPARIRVSNENQNVNFSQNLQQQQPLSLSRSNSRKAEISPYRRNPLGEIDTNIISQEEELDKAAAPIQKPNADNKIAQGAENKIINNNNNNLTNTNFKNQEQHPSHVALNVIPSGPENPKTQPVTRSRSSRLSRDLDINPETLTNPNTSSYTALLLEDIQNFHQKNTPPPTAFSLPPCVTKACSILEAVADLNSTTGSNLSSPFSSEQMNKSSENNFVKKMTKQDFKDPIVESEVVVNDDLIEPSFHKYVTVRRGTSGDDEDLEEQESSGSNSFAGSQQHWVSSSSWEPNSAESTDRWTSSSSSRRNVDEGGKRVVVSGKKRDSDNNGIGRGRNGSRSSYMTLTAASS